MLTREEIEEWQPSVQIPQAEGPQAGSHPSPLDSTSLAVMLMPDPFQAVRNLAALLRRCGM